eukprot:1593232-Alexandrium_andersonii.AAC.1
MKRMRISDASDTAPSENEVPAPTPCSKNQSTGTNIQNTDRFKKYETCRRTSTGTWPHKGARVGGAGAGGPCTSAPPGL